MARRRVCGALLRRAVLPGPASLGARLLMPMEAAVLRGAGTDPAGASERAGSRGTAPDLAPELLDSCSLARQCSAALPAAAGAAPVDLRLVGAHCPAWHELAAAESCGATPAREPSATTGGASRTAQDPWFLQDGTSLPALVWRGAAPGDLTGTATAPAPITGAVLPAVHPRHSALLPRILRTFASAADTDQPARGGGKKARKSRAREGGEAPPSVGSDPGPPSPRSDSARAHSSRASRGGNAGAQPHGSAESGPVFPKVDAEAIVRGLEADGKLKDMVQLPSSDRTAINRMLRHFAESGWAADQALAIYINSRFFPSAAAKFRKFVLRSMKRESELSRILLGAGRGRPSQAANEFLFPVFAEFCFNEFAQEIKTYRQLVESADMTKPHTWYPYARALKRRVVYHMGPTNSGKTHQALVRFKEAASGIYCGPLRLLAMEVFDRVNSDGVYCNLVTGQERKEMPFAQHTACTIEMANLFQPVEVAVIDEIQMISDEYRGWAWTRAVLGVQATEVHVCGDPSALRVLQALCNASGDELLCATYSRFAPLTVDQSSLDSDLGRVEPGDCLVAFSRRNIFDIKRQVEVLARQRCCVVYGALPPETRRQQAQLFNEENSGFNVLVASDAVGMGLNLNIRRIIFSTLTKFNGDGKVPIPSPMVKQIAGRAGRRGSLFQQGVVTCLHKHDVPQLVTALQEDVLPAKEAGLFPVFEQVEVFASQLPEMTFSQLINRFVETSRVDGQYFICRTDNILRVAGMLDRVNGLSLRDRFHFCFAPVNTRDPAVMATLLQYAEKYAAEEPVTLSLPPPSALTASVMSAANAMQGPGASVPSKFSLHLIALEAQHQVASMYLWLAEHFPSETFPDQDKATAIAQGAAQQLAATLLSPPEHLLASQPFRRSELGSARSRRALSPNLERHPWDVGPAVLRNTQPGANLTLKSECEERDSAVAC